MKSARGLPLLIWRFRKDLLMVWEMLKSPAAPKRAKFVALAAIAYVISPIDLVPDIAPILGWIDDAAVLVGLLSLSLKMLPADLHAEFRRKVYGEAPTASDVPNGGDAATSNGSRTGAGRASTREAEIIDVTPVRS
jgi:uncharacterized membrane protein YkvA (DUF1232 family)